MATTIKLKNGSGAPLAGDLVAGEPALDLTNKRLYTENSSGAVIEVGTNPTSLTTGTVTTTGNLLVGNTVTDPATSNVNGAAITAGGEVIASLNGVAAQFNRRTSDGDIAVFKKGGTTVGSIGVLSSRFYIGSGDTGLKFSGADDLISPIDASDGTGRDAAIDLGSSGARFKDIYLSGTVNAGGGTVVSSGSNAFSSKAVGGYAIQAYQDATSANHTALDLRTDSTTSTRFLIRGYNNAAVTPAEVFSVGADGSAFLNGNVGIGTSSPDAVLTSVNSGALTLDSNDGNHSGFGLLIEPSTITANTVNSAIGFAKSDGRKYAAIGMQTYADVDQNGLNFYVQSTTSGSSAVLSEAMRIDSDGNVGIGTGLPNTELHLLKSGSDADVTIEGTGTGVDARINLYANSTGVSQIRFGDEADTNIGLLSYVHSDDSMQFRTNNSERMRINSNGSLEISGNGANNEISQFLLNVGNPSNDSYRPMSCHVASTAARSQILFYNPAGQVGYISTSGTSTSYNTSSDYRLKENVVPLTGATERVKQLNPSRFNFIADADTTVDGFLAHEVADVVPEAITGTKDGMLDEEYEVTPAVYEDVVIPAVLDEEGNEVEAERIEQQLVSEAVMGTRSVPDYQGIDQSKLVPLLVATIQELEARITALESN